MNHTPHNESNERQSDLAAKVMHRIEGDHVRPRARWEFLLHNYTLWTLWALAVLLGAGSVAASIFVFMNLEWRLYAATHHSLWEFVIESLPYLWIVVLGLFVFIASENIRRTRRGYRYPLWMIVVLSVLGSTCGGVVLYAAGVGQVVDESIGRRIPLHRPVLMLKRDRWIQPRNGLWAGEIADVDAEADYFTLKTFNGTEWEVDGVELTPQDWNVLEEFSQVHVIGVPVLDAAGNVLHACFVMPWKVHGERMKMLGFGPETVPTPVMHEKIVREFMATASPIAFERKPDETRTTPCEDVRLYTTIQKLRASESNY